MGAGQQQWQQRCGWAGDVGDAVVVLVVSPLAEGGNVVDAVEQQRQLTGEIEAMATTQDPERWAELGAWIADRRKQLGLDQKQLAQAAGVSENTIGNYERGRVPARGKMAAGYYQVEKVLQFAKGSFDNILDGFSPIFAVEGSSAGLLRLRDPEEVEDPKAKILIPIIAEALQYKKLAMTYADLAYRWNASEAAIDRFKDAVENLLIDMISPGHGPAELVRYLEEREAQGKPITDPKRPELGWTALVADLAEADARNTVGSRLLAARSSKGTSVEQLSQRSKVPERVIRLIEADDFNFPGAFMHAPVYIELLADCLEIPSAPLLELFEAEHAPQDHIAEGKVAYQKWRDSGGLERAFPEAEQ